MFLCSTLVGQSVFFLFFFLSLFLVLSVKLFHVLCHLFCPFGSHFPHPFPLVWQASVIYLGFFSWYMATVQRRSHMLFFFPPSSHVSMSHVPSLSVCFVFSSSISIGLANQCDLDVFFVSFVFFFSLHIFTSFFVCTLACSLSCF